MLGIGACSTALKRIGIDVEIVDAVEIDKYAIASFNAIHGTNFEVQDICEWDKDIKDIDLITHGSPCQDFSVAGKQAGGDIGSGTRSSLMYETIRIVGKIRPKYVIWENVKNLLSKKHKHNFDAYIETMNILGYNSYYQVLNAKDYGIPQNRERVFTISIRKDIDKGYTFPEKEELKLRLKDMLEDKVDEKYYLSDTMLKGFMKHNENHKRKATGFIWKPKSQNDIASTLRANAALCPTDNTIKVIGNYMPSNHDASRIVNSNGIAPTVKENHGTVTATNVCYIEKKYDEFVQEKGYIPEMFNPYNMTEIKDIAPTQSTCCGSTTSSATVLIKENNKADKYDVNGLAPTLTQQEEKIMINNATKKGYDEAKEGDAVNLSYPNSKTRRGRVGHQVSQTLQCNDSMGVVTNSEIKVIGNYMPSGHDASRIVDSEGLAPTVKENHGTVTATNQNLRIRKLTPKECWRLMGFSDEDFEKAVNIPTSNTQLYKQARKFNLCTGFRKNIY